MRFPAPVINCQDHKSVLSKPFTHNSFRHTIEDDSMINAHLPVGAVINVNPDIKAQSGLIVLGKLNGHYIVRRLAKTGKCLVLHADNTLYKPIILTREMDFKICGVVTEVVIGLI